MSIGGISAVYGLESSERGLGGGLMAAKEPERLKADHELGACPVNEESRFDR
jgi:hypothetical protein